MLQEETRRRQSELNEELYKLSQSPIASNDIRKVALKLNEIYKSDFRHSYSEFFPVLLRIFEEPTYDMDYLANNIELIRELVEKDYLDGNKEFSDMSSKFFKLSDHLNLEIARILYYSKYNQQAEDISAKMVTLTLELNKATQDLNKASERAQSMQTELVSILSIFSAIVIAFSGGISFLGNTIAASQNSYICKLILLILGCGGILFNTIFLLMYLVAKITDRNIYAKCKSEDCSGNTCKCNNLTKIRKRLPYIFYFNIALIIFIILDIVVWCLDKWII